jgi:choline dehydrogenase
MSGMLTGTFPAGFWKKNARIDPVGYVPETLLADDAEGFASLVILLHPYSTGHMQLRSANYRDKPLIYPGYLSDERDVDTMAAGAIECVKLIHAMGYSDQEIMTMKDMAHLSISSPEYWKNQVRRYASTIYHPSSTCAMGKVVSSDLKVIGAKKLRVADASVFPHLTSGNTNAPAIMVGEMAADIIMKEHGMVNARPF